MFCFVVFSPMIWGPLTHSHWQMCLWVRHWLLNSSRGRRSMAGLSVDGSKWKEPHPAGINTIHVSSSVTFLFPCALLADSKSFLVNSRIISLILPQIPPAETTSIHEELFFFLPPSRFGRMLPLLILHHFSPPSNNPISVPWVGWISASRAPCKTSHVTKHWAD